MVLNTYSSKSAYYNNCSHYLSPYLCITLLNLFSRFLNDKGEVVERVLALHHVKDTTSEALKNALYDILDRYKLSISRYEGKDMMGLRI